MDAPPVEPLFAPALDELAEVTVVSPSPAVPGAFDEPPTIEEMPSWLDILPRANLEQYVLWAMCFIVFRITLTLLRLSNTKYKPYIRKPFKAMFVLGSGGHTTEMFRLITGLNRTLYSPRIYVHSRADQLSVTKTAKYEGTRKDYRLQPMARIREVHQSLITVPFTAIRPLLEAPYILLLYRPDVLIVNGPGMCIPLILWSFVFAVFCLKRPVIIFVESFCRVHTLSLTARLMRTFVDRLVVQWRPVHEKYKKQTSYHGLLV